MDPLNEYIRFSEEPVKIKPFDTAVRRFAEQYLMKLNKLFPGRNIKIQLRGSTAYGISGKGDIEYGLYPSAADWDETLQMLKSHFGDPENLEPDYVRFNSLETDQEIEIIVMRGRQAEIDQRLQSYLLSHRTVLKEYEQIKAKFAFSKREYQKQKDIFFEKVIADLERF